MLPLIKTTDTRAYVHTADPPVHARDAGAIGWISLDSAELVAEEGAEGAAALATVVHLRPLNAVEYFAARAKMLGAAHETQYGEALIDLVKLAVVRVEHYNGDLARDLPGPLLDELGSLVLRISADAA